MSLLRPCLGPAPGLSCPDDEYVVRGRCPACATARGRERGTTRERGYGAGHQRARDGLAELLPAPCHYCGAEISTSDRWVAAHLVDGDPVSPRVPAHPICNERAKRRA